MRPDECFGTNGECTIYNVKNIASIRHKSTGTYCVAPTPGLNFSGVTPALTIDAFNSGPDSLGSGFGVPVVAYSSQNACSSGEITVKTYRESATMNGTPALSDNSSFGIVVP
jgi:hypothetical protein